MPAPTPGFLSSALKILGPVFAFVRPVVGKWWKRWRISSASSDKISILVARIGGDSSANTHHHSIREAIKSAVPSAVEILGWFEELPIGDGPDGVAHMRAEGTARKWMKAKNCELLISGRVKSANVISLTFTPLSSDSTVPPDLNSGPRNYALPVDTMELPTAFIDDLGAAIAAYVIANISKSHNIGFVPALENVASQLEKITEVAAIKADARTKARLFDCEALARGILFGLTGRESDLTRANKASEAALALIDREQYPAEWARIKSRAGIGLARLGEQLGNLRLLEQGADAMRSALPDLSNDLLSWSKAQLNLAAVYSTIAQITGSLDDVKRALEIYDEIITDELRNRDKYLWAAAQHNYGGALVALAEKQPGDDALSRAMDAFGLALEVRDDGVPRQRSDTLVNLSAALIALGTRQSSLDPNLEAIHYLREAEQLVPIHDAPRKWLLIQNNLGLALALVGQEDANKRRVAIRVLRNALGKAKDASPNVSLRLSINLAKALMFAGNANEDFKLLSEAEEILKRCLKSPRMNSDIRVDVSNDLGLALYFTGRLSERIEFLAEAREIFERLCGELSPKDQPFRWIRANCNLGLVLRSLGEIEESTEHLNSSLIVFSRPLELISKDSAPAAWASCQFFLAGTHFEIAKRVSNMTHLQNAQIACANALSVLGPQRTGPLPREARLLGQAIEQLEAEREESTSQIM